MKLRNKNKGEIIDIESFKIETPLMQAEIDSLEELNDLIKELNEEWEDYTPAEPLIKDEKVRKAVKAWCEVIGATKNIVFDGSNKVYSFYYENNKGGFEKLLIYGDNDLEELKRYTITDLCGEGEE